jgi:hypothetical protein
MNLKHQFLLPVPILPDDDFVTMFGKIAPFLVFDTTEKVHDFIFKQSGFDISEDIVDSLDDLHCDEQNALVDLINDTFESIRKKHEAEYNILAGGLSAPRHAASQRALKKVMGSLNDSMRIACASFTEGVFAVRDLNREPICKDELKPGF